MRPTCTLYFFLFVVDEKIQNQCMPFSPKLSLSKGHLCHLICIFVYNLAISAIKRHFCHFCQNRHFPTGPFAISFEFMFTVWRLSAISAIFAEIVTFQRAPLPSHLNFCLQFGDFGYEAPFLPFSPNTPFSPKSPLCKGPLCHLI